MHEFTIACSVVEEVERIAKEHMALSVSKVFLKIGPFSCIDTNTLSFAFDALKEGRKLLGGAELLFLKGEGDEVIIERVELDV